MAEATVAAPEEKAAAEHSVGGRIEAWAAALFVLLVVYSLDIPFSSTGVPWNSGWKWSSLNYSPLVLIVGLVVGIWWVVDAKKKYTGPVRTIDEVPIEETGPESAPTPTPAG